MNAGRTSTDTPSNARRSTATNEKEFGTIVVVVLKARNLPDKHTFTKQDPYAVVQLGSSKASTNIDKRGGQHPVWDQDLHLKVSAEATKENRNLKVSCFAKEPKDDVLIGEGEIDISETLTSGEFDDWVKLEINGAYRGEVYLEITFFAAGPRNLTRRPSKLAPSERLWRPQQLPPKTPPKTSPQTSPNGSPSSRRPAELPLSLSPKRDHLAPPSAWNEPPLPSVPSEIPAALLPHAGVVPVPARAGVGATSASQEIPSALRPGGPPRPTVNAHQHTTSVPVAAPAHTPAPPSASHTVGPAFAHQTSPRGYTTPNAPNGYIAPGALNYGGYTPAPGLAATTSLPFAFPEPSIPNVLSPVLSPGSGDAFGRASATTGFTHADPYAAASRENEARLATRYGSPLPLPAGTSREVTPTPTPAPREPRSSHPHHVQAPAVSADTPDPYLEREHAALARVRQEEADAELARRIQTESAPGCSHAPPGRNQSVNQEEADEEFARRLARELNVDVLKQTTVKEAPGASNIRMPGGWK
ncbi:hypothetical protein M0805_005879 [Coniferiporia weirii]|nr:hypothetical protein M0805_005879 [Coniferiporia weirii]